MLKNQKGKTDGQKQCSSQNEFSINLKMKRSILLLFALAIGISGRNSRFQACISNSKAQNRILCLRGGKRASEKKTCRESQKPPAYSESTDTEEISGLTYQEPTPKLKGHRDKLAPRDASSYAAEAARCMSELDVDGALACYVEALRLEPESGMLLDAYASLLADQGRSVTGYR